MRVQLRQATLQDAIELAGKLRQGDLNELQALGHTNIDECLMSSFNVSHIAYALTLEDELIGIQGLAKGLNDKHGAIWAMGSERTKEVPRDIVRLGFEFTNECLGHYPAVGNMVYCNNKLHIRWLKLIGYTFIRELNYNNNNFYEFVKIKEYV
ncbi:phage protein Gp13 family protein [Endozoicomonas sp. SESOKO1]|uniref:phage protein Gp13 family protein n=1 Tax=Endozoicomonas sp. SESOKO1 TaxID=2828742 RepID=UPI00214862DC|nr:phage protein Gp13 family protein [Endozoicomonas sp. SESOKO1]